MNMNVFISQPMNGKETSEIQWERDELVKELKRYLGEDIKILDTISNLNKQGMYPLSDGVYKIVAGIVDEETANLRDEPTFATLISSNIFIF